MGSGGIILGVGGFFLGAGGCCWVYFSVGGWWTVFLG